MRFREFGSLREDAQPVETVTIDWTAGQGRRSQVISREWRIVWVDVAKIDASWSKDYAYVGPGGEGGTRKRYPDFGRWLKTRTVPVEMPEIGMGQALGCIMFLNGRHRFSWMRDHGAKALPVLVSAEDAAVIERKFGSTKRETVIRAE